MAPDALVRPTAPLLYKYGSVLPYLEQILLKHELYFSSPSQLKDPLDTRPRFVVTSRDGMLRRMVNPYLAEHSRDMTLEELAHHVRFMITWVGTAPLIELADSSAKSFHEAMEGHRLYSMTTRPDNDHLWEAYAAGHTGWCLEFENQSLFVYAHHVIYDVERRIDFSSPDVDNEWKLLYRKTLAYRPEEEVRIYKFPRGQSHETPFNPVHLRRIIFGKNMTADTRRTILGWCRHREPALLAVDET